MSTTSPKILTVRQRIAERIAEREMGARELSRQLGIREKAVYDHLVHLSRSVRAKGGRLTVTPAACLACGFVFRERRRLTPPGRCPKCRSTHLTEPTYRIR